MADEPEKNNEPGSQPQKPFDEGSAVPATASLSIDWEFYAEHLEDSDLTDDQKREFIETLWNIVLAFVDLGFGVHPIQQASDYREHGAVAGTAEQCEQITENRIILPDDLLSSWEDIPNNTTDNHADDAPRPLANQEES